MNGDDDAIALAERVLTILEEGSFSGTYKYALIVAILDLCLEYADRDGMPPSTLTTRQLAEKVIELYWDHVLPFGGLEQLRQGGVRAGNQAEIIRRISDARQRWAETDAYTIERARRHRTDFERLVRDVEWKLTRCRFPAFRLWAGL